jgi:hypothetical protein
MADEAGMKIGVAAAALTIGVTACAAIGCSTEPSPSPERVGATRSALTGYIGCFEDAGDRALPAFFGGGHTIESCQSAVRSSGLPYAGVQWYGECWGGSELRWAQRPEWECDTPCSANSSEICGGAWRNSIYASGASEPVPPDPEPTPTPTSCRQDGQACGGDATCCSNSCNTQTWTCGPKCVKSGESGCGSRGCCDSNAYCEYDGVCRGGYDASCTWSGQCATGSGYVCSYGKCKAGEGSGCWSDTQCADSLRCIDYRCQTSSSGTVTATWGGGGGEERTTFKGCTLHEGDWISTSDCETCGCSVSGSFCQCSLFMED